MSLKHPIKENKTMPLPKAMLKWAGGSEIHLCVYAKPPYFGDGRGM